MICSYSTPFKAGVGRHFDPRSPQGERLLPGVVGNGGLEISIHAPREGSDLLGRLCRQLAQISIHAPREGSDMML